MLNYLSLNLSLLPKYSWQHQAILVSSKCWSPYSQMFSPYCVWTCCLSKRRAPCLSETCHSWPFSRHSIRSRSYWSISIRWSFHELEPAGFSYDQSSPLLLRIRLLTSLLSLSSQTFKISVLWCSSPLG